VTIDNKFYDFLKYLALLVLPALGAVYFVLTEVASMPSPTHVLGALLIAILLLGIVLTLSSRAYAVSDARFDGQMDVQDLGDRKVDQDQLMAVTDKKEVVFKVNQIEA
jgi:hypothetical protein